MKLFTKICFVSAGISAILGIIGIVIGLSLGAGLNDLKEMGIYLSPHQQIHVRVRGNEIFLENDKKRVEEEIEKKVEHMERIEDNLEERAEEMEKILEWKEEKDNMVNGHHKTIELHH